MSDIISYQDNVVTSGVVGDTHAVSCCGVPGMGNLSSAYVYVMARLRTLLDSDGYLWFANVDGATRQTGMRDDYGVNNWYVQTILGLSQFNVNYGGSLGTFEEQYAGRYFQRNIWHIAGASQSFEGGYAYKVENMPINDAQATQLGYWNSHWKVSDLNLTTSGNTVTAPVYIAYPITYGNSDTPIGLPALQFTLEFTQIVTNDYFPFATFNSGAWKSCNRSGGSVQRYSSGWQNVKNRQGDSANSHAFYFNGSWAIAPKVGAE